MDEYNRDQVRRLLAVSERQLRSWERQKLVPASERYGFPELVALRTLVKLRGDHVPPARIRQAVSALRKTLRDIGNPLTELKIFAEGRRIGVHIAGQRMEAVTGQLLFDFDREELNRLLSFPVANRADNEVKFARHEAERWFQRGLELEQTGAPIEDVIAAYRNAVELDANAAGALVNLGTICFNGQKWKEAEEYYRRAIEADPEYALAHFNLGNLFDEQGARAKAFEHYQAALRLSPSYADAHYNLALLYQTSGQLMKAVYHWRTYLKLDPASVWAVIAKRELDKLRQATVVRGAKTAE